ncbi:hypothetical protein ACFYYR_17090 [Streptomyces sp. NPDC001922]|uniref:hypothetical protein n=1 Tax=Streptomyces sp. NPDC001922 TaxID=3364624 RepID=UPI00369F47BC
MSHSGQGNDPHLPAATPAHEGVVLPAHGESWVPEQSGPAAGQPWGQPWGPEPAQPQAAQQQPAQQQAPQSHATQPHATQPQAAQPLPAEESGDAQATQYIPPVSAGAPLPPEVRDQPTQFLGRRSLAEQGSDAEATQLIGAPVPAPEAPSRAPYGIRPGMPGDRQPPAEFDGLFRADAGDSSPGSTQQIPRYDPQFDAPQQQYEPPARSRKGLSPVALIAIVIAGCTVAGLAAGAALSGDDGDKGVKKAAQSSAAGAEEDEKESPSAAADPAEQQAKSLDSLLEDSNNSRSTVIRSVENTRTCTNLGQSAQDLRAAAGQRNGLVTRLQKLSVDELPNNAALTASLTRAWKASAAADNHYAAWADQVGGRKGCHKGRARVTPQAAAGNRASGQATVAKKEAAALWNKIASKYGLPQRQFTQL